MECVPAAAFGLRRVRFSFWASLSRGAWYLAVGRVGDGLGEAVTFAADGVDVFGVLLVFFELLAQPGDVDVDRPRAYFALVFPHVLQ